MLTRHNAAHTRLALRHRRERNPGRHYARLKQRAAEFHRLPALANDDRRNWRLTRRCRPPADIKSRSAQLLLEVPRVRPQPLDTLGLLLQNVERRDARRRNGRWM